MPDNTSAEDINSRLLRRRSVTSTDMDPSFLESVGGAHRSRNRDFHFGFPQRTSYNHSASAGAGFLSFTPSGADGREGGRPCLLRHERARPLQTKFGAVGAINAARERISAPPVSEIGRAGYGIPAILCRREPVGTGCQ